MMNVKTKRIFKLVFVTLLADLLAFTLILPLLPKILDYYASNDKSGFYKSFDDNVKTLQNLLNVPESHNKVLLAGILGSWFSFLQFISSPFLGAISDRIGRKPVMVLAMCGTVLSYSIWFIASNSFWLFILSRTVGGLCKANVGLSLAIISDVSDENSRGKGMAVVGSSFSLAFIFGPLLGAYLTTLAKGDQLQSQLITNPSLIATLLSLINVAFVIIFLDETFAHTQNVSKTISRSKFCSQGKFSLSRAFHYVNPKSLFAFTLVDKKNKTETAILYRVGFIYFYYLLFYSGLEFTLSFLTHIRFGFTSMQQGKLYLYSGLLMAIMQGGYIRRMKGGNEARLALVGLAVVVPSFAIMGLSTCIGHIYMSLTFYALSSAIVVPCLTTIISSYSPPKSKGAVMGTFRSIGSLARAIGPCFASLMFWTFGSKLCYIGGALVLILPIYLMKILNSELIDKKSKKSAAR